MVHISGLVTDPTIVFWGLGYLTFNGVVYYLFRHVLPPGPWKAEAFFTSKLLVAFLNMVFMTVIGSYAWFLNPEYYGDGTCAKDNIYTESSEGVFMSKVVVGTLVYWDIPLEFVAGIDKMDKVMMVHHVAMLSVATILLGFWIPESTDYTTLGTCFAPLFFGVIEVSSIFLDIAALFHPKQKYWHEWHSSIPWVVTLNTTARVLFTLSFMVVRVVYFPIQIYGFAIPEFHGALIASANLATSICLWIMLFFGFFFTFLQWYWGYMVVKLGMKLLRSNNNNDGSSSSTNGSSSSTSSSSAANGAGAGGRQQQAQGSIPQDKIDRREYSAIS